LIHYGAISCTCAGGSWITVSLPSSGRLDIRALVVRGQPTLRTPEGEHDLTEGDVFAFLRGDAGLHQVTNRVKGERAFLSRPGPMLDYWDGED
jgi:hypothetical protein